MANLPIISHDPVRIVCISDTRSDNFTASLPEGDILFHAGNITKDGTLDEFRTAYKWLSALPHRIKVFVPGHHDVGLDEAHLAFLPEALQLFTSPKAQEDGIFYVDRNCASIALVKENESTTPGYSTARPLTVYGNPLQPDLLDEGYRAFTYEACPSHDAASAWCNAPRSTTVPIWVIHGPPETPVDDETSIPLMELCEFQALSMARARPVLVVSGQYRCRRGIDIVTWKIPRDANGKVDDSGEVDIMSVENLGGLAEGVLDFTDSKYGLGLKKGEKTIFIHASWISSEDELRRKDGKCCSSCVLELPLGLLIS